MKTRFAQFLADERGATAIEYGLIAALLAIGMIAGLSAMGDSVDDKFADLSDNLDNAQDSDVVAIAGGD